MGSFFPCYDSREVERLMNAWLTGSLDTIVADGGVMVGVEGCSKAPFGLRPEGLLTRFLREDVTDTLIGMGGGDTESKLAALFCLQFGAQVPVVDIARAMGWESPTVLDLSIEARDAFMARLLASKRKDKNNAKTVRFSHL